MKVCAISDLHGYLPNIEQSDILLIAGDISPLNIQFNKPEMKKWLELQFAYWIKSLPVERVFLIAGNHDSYFESIMQSNILALEFACDKLVYLKNECVHYYDKDCTLWSIFGTPYCKIFGNWAFMREDENLRELYKFIPDGCDILISHDAADINNLGLVPPNVWHPSSSVNAGNKVLAEAVKEKKPKYSISGHIHSGEHKLQSYEECPDTQFACVSIIDENYQMSYEPLVFKI